MFHIQIICNSFTWYLFPPTRQAVIGVLNWDASFILSRKIIYRFPLMWRQNVGCPYSSTETSSRRILCVLYHIPGTCFVHVDDRRFPSDEDFATTTAFWVKQILSTFLNDVYMQIAPVVHCAITYRSRLMHAGMCMKITVSRWHSFSTPINRQTHFVL